MRYNIRNILIFILILSVSCSFKKTEPIIFPFSHIKVLILSKYNPSQVTFQVESGMAFLSESSFILKNEKVVITTRNNSLELAIRGKRYVTDYVSISSKELKLALLEKGMWRYRTYSGEISISLKELKPLFILKTDVEYYTHNAAQAEIGQFLLNNKKGELEDWQRELLKAVKIAIRSYIFHFESRHDDGAYEFCDLTHCTFFPGKGKILQERAEVFEVMMENDSFLPAYFHSTCGGVLTGPDAYWLRHAYFKHFHRGAELLNRSGRPSCQESPHFTWQKRVPMLVLNKILGKEVYQLHTELSKQGRVKKLVYKTTNGKQGSITASSFLSKAGRTLGWNAIKSNYFKVSKHPSFWVFEGQGLGHGVGLCQWGAMSQAKAKQNYREILAFYYNSPRLVVGKYPK